MLRNRVRYWKQTFWWLALLLLLYQVTRLSHAQETGNIDDITGNYHFLSPDDTLGLLEEEGKLKGYIEVLQGDEESDAMLSYDIISGTRQNGHVEFKTRTIHRKYYRFSGKAERGSGRQPDDPDYLRLIGDLEIVTVKGDNGKESVDRKHLILKSFGKSEQKSEQNSEQNDDQNR